MSCKICGNETRKMEVTKDCIIYHYCDQCEFISKDSNYYVTEEQELLIYNRHNNSIHDETYVAYFRNFINKTILKYKSEGTKGLDFGSGPEPVLSELLKRDYGYEMDIYDKFYAPEKTFEGNCYDLVTSTEVIEHLDDPIEYFRLFVRLLEKDGILAVMTQFHPKDDVKFAGWHYRRDPSHISFYTPETIRWIADLVGLEVVFIDRHKNITLKHKKTEEGKMKLIESYTHKDVADQKLTNIHKRTTARGIILNGDEILMIYTKRYNDYSFPGGGVDPEEAIEEGLLRELSEETGAQNVRIIGAFGRVEELRPIHFPEYDAMYQISYFYTCSADQKLGKANPEAYELQNGSEPVWVKLVDAIEHNKKVIEQNDESIGLSIQRETIVLERILENMKNVSA
ncbi:MAG: methyltransferase domain-containing protein [Clostridia bacterium]|nr:methyltransferase domain-containing protein [Clostridia bacterium]